MAAIARAHQLRLMLNLGAKDPMSDVTPGQRHAARRTSARLAGGLAALAVSLGALASPVAALAAPADGRVYERVTPNDKGAQARLDNVIAFDDERVVYVSLSAVAPAVSGNGNAFSVERTAAGWTMSSLNTSADVRTTVYLYGQAFNRSYTSWWWPAYAPTDSNKTWVMRRVNGGPAEPVGGAGGQFNTILEGESQMVVSDDGARAVLLSAGRFVLEDPGGGIYMLDAAGRHPVAVDNGGNVLCGVPSYGHINASSGDLSLFYFETGGGSCPGPRHVYLRKGFAQTIDVGRSRRATPDPAGPGAQKFFAASRDGMRALFTSTEQLVDEDTNAHADLYLYDAGTDGLTLVSKDAVTSDDLDFQNIVRSSDDLDQIYFVGAGQLNGQGTAGVPNLYRWQPGRVHYVTTIPTNITPASTIYGPNENWYAQVTPSGDHLIFDTSDQLLPGDADTAIDIYGYDAVHGVLKLLTPGTEQDVLVGSSSAPLDRFSIANDQVVQRLLSDDGQYGVFQTAEALDPQDVDGLDDIYRWRWSDGDIALVSTATDNRTKIAGGIPPSGKSIFLQTIDSLVGSGDDKERDIYDARIGGGFPESQRPVPCSRGGMPRAGDVAGVAAFACVGCAGRGRATPTPSSAARWSVG